MRSVALTPSVRPGRDVHQTANRSFALGLATLALWGAASEGAMLVDVSRGDALTSCGWSALVIDGLIDVTLVVAAVWKWRRRARLATKFIAIAVLAGLLVLAFGVSSELPVWALMWSLPAIGFIATSIVLDLQAIERIHSALTG